MDHISLFPCPMEAAKTPFMSIEWQITASLLCVNARFLVPLLFWCRKNRRSFVVILPWLSRESTINRSIVLLVSGCNPLYLFKLSLSPLYYELRHSEFSTSTPLAFSQTFINP